MKTLHGHKVAKSTSWKQRETHKHCRLSTSREGFHNKDEIVKNVVIPPSVRFQEISFHHDGMERGSIKMFLDSETEPYLTVQDNDKAFEVRYPPIGLLFDYQCCCGWKV